MCLLPGGVCWEILHNAAALLCSVTAAVLKKTVETQSIPRRMTIARNGDGIWVDAEESCVEQQQK